MKWTTNCSVELYHTGTFNKYTTKMSYFTLCKCFNRRICCCCLYFNLIECSYIIKMPQRATTTTATKTTIFSIYASCIKLYQARALFSNNIVQQTKGNEKLLTLRSLKNSVFLAQSTCENRFWSNTLHINSKRSTSHWLYDWLWSSEKSCVCHSRSSTDWTNSRIIGDTLGKFKLFEFFQYCFLLTEVNLVLF